MPKRNVKIYTNNVKILKKPVLKKDFMKKQKKC